MKITLKEIKEKIKGGKPKPYYGDLGYSYEAAFAVEDEGYYFIEVHHFGGDVKYEIVPKENDFVEVII